MKRVVLLIVFCSSMSLFSSNKDSLAVGFKLEGMRDNLGLHLDIVSPTFLKYFNGRVSGGVVLEGEEYKSEHNKFLFGLRGYGAPVTDFLKLYGEFGGVFLLEEEDVEPGIYGLFGFEFYTAREYKSPVSYFIEMGTNGLLEGSRNGFTTNVGFRYYF